MKNKVFLFLLCAALSNTLAMAQKQLPPSALPAAENLTYTLVKALQRAGFELPVRAGTTAPAVSRAAELRLDSTKTFYGYDLNGTPDSTPLFRTVYQYPDPLVSVATEYQYDGGAWITLNRSTQYSDDQGRLVEVFAELFDPLTHDFRPDSRLEIYPRGDSPELIDSAFTTYWSVETNDWVELITIWNTYDDQEQLLESLTRLNILGDFLLFRDVFTYDDFGNNTLIESFALLGQDEFPAGRREMTYNQNNQLMTVTALSLDDFGVYQPQSQVTYTYTVFGNEAQVNSYEWNGAQQNWIQTESITYNYDNQQRVVARETRFFHQSDPEERELVNFEYVEGADLALETLFIWDSASETYFLSDKKYYYYSSGSTALDPTPEPVQQLSVSPNPTQGLVRLSVGEETGIQVFSLSGQLMQSVILQPGQMLDLSALPAGIYSISARDTQGYYLGKVVKQ